MSLQTLRDRYESATPGRRRLWVLGSLLLAGLLLLPALIYLAGLSLLGAYEGGSFLGQYGSIYSGLAQGNWSAWIVVLGPTMLVILGRALLSGWRRSARLAGQDSAHNP